MEDQFKTYKSLGKNKNMAMGPTEYKIESDSADEGQQQMLS
jgi:hypothetical protein